MTISLPYGNTRLHLDMDWARCLDFLTPRMENTRIDPSAALEAGLQHPIGFDSPLALRLARGGRMTVVLSDAFRRTGIDRLLPTFLDYVISHGIRESDIRFLFATGVHRAPSPEEQQRIVGPSVYHRFKSQMFVHDAGETASLLSVGTTQRGTPVWLNKHACACEHLVLTGTAVFHYFAGFGGGRKALVPGVAGAETIAHNHRLNLHPTESRLDPAVRIGVLDGNPVAEDLLEAARLCPPALIINTVLNSAGDISGVFVGEMDAAHRAACRYVEKLYSVPIREPADLVVASAGDAQNFIQSHKALFNAFQAMKPEGIALLLAAAPEGLGAGGFRRHIETGDPESVVASLRREADINGQTALSTLQKASRTVLISDMPGEDAKALGMRAFTCGAEAVAFCREEFIRRANPHPTFYAMPFAGYTVPLMA